VDELLEEINIWIENVCHHILLTTMCELGVETKVIGPTLKHDLVHCAFANLIPIYNSYCLLLCFLKDFW